MSDSILDTLKSKPLSQLTSEEMSDAKKLAWEIIRADYWRDVRGVAESVEQAIKDKEVTGYDGLTERVSEECDGSARVIYTSEAIECMMASDNDSAYFEDFGSEGATDNDSINWSRLAFCAFERDVQRQLESMGYGPDYDFDGEEETEDSEEESAR